MAETALKADPPNQEQLKVDAGQRRAAADLKLPDKIHCWPYLVRAEFIAGCIMTIGLLVWSLVVDAPLEEPANPSKTPNPSKAPWYFLGLQEMLVYFDPWIAGVVLPGLIIAGLMVIPYVDINPNGNGYYTFRERPFAVSTFLFGFLVLWVGFIVLGVFFRGPGWNLFWPWEYWDPHKVVPMTNRDLPYLLGARGEAATFLIGMAAVGGWFAVGPLVWVWKRKKPFMQKLGLTRYTIVSFLYLCMLGTVVKIVLRLVFGVKYVWVWPNVFNI
ncbi:MAG: cytochrome C [Myxococcales bacterium]|nr:cytochrome C [Myxococcales bacterium]